MKKDLNKALSSLHFVSQEFLGCSYDFWLKDRTGFRTPFPTAIQEKLREVSLSAFLEWASGLSKAESKKLTKEEIAQMFELLLFNKAIDLVESEDDELTIRYPFMPRVGDKVNDHQRGESQVVKREVLEHKNGKLFFNVTLRGDESGEKWSTEFELPG